ncbi:BRCT domain-containing protein [Halomonas sp. M20]|uniref:BRCT domain-containing protein n=1 Tax=Halomonas sp. M20 TaxID=2763264 RepID=UPI001D0AFF4B|nr:BRCT domain-containing protein [Halomonas sp. M20]
MEGLVFWVIAGAVLIFMVRRTKRKAREVEAQYSQSATPRNSAQFIPAARLCFIYEDAEGNITKREVSHFQEDGAYIKGFCQRANDVRTFRRDRIVDFLEGEELLGGVLDKVDAPAFSNGSAMEILFTGFSNDVRENLETEAKDAGLLVRKTVTKNLTFLCAGPKPGGTKTSQARAQGCTILNEDEFAAMLATGELPS